MTIQHYRNLLLVPVLHLSRNAHGQERLLRSRLYSAFALSAFYHNLNHGQISIEQPPEFVEAFEYIPKEQEREFLQREFDQIKAQFTQTKNPLLLDFFQLRVQPLMDERHAYLLAAIYSYQIHIRSIQEQVFLQHNNIPVHTLNQDKSEEQKVVEKFLRYLAKHSSAKEFTWFSSKFNEALKECQLIRTHYDSDLSNAYKYKYIKTVCGFIVFILILLVLQFGLHYFLYESENAPLRKPTTILVKPLPEKENHNEP